MNKFLSNLILFGFIGIAVFGFLAMGHGAAGWCLAQTANRAVCPAGSYAAASFYANTFKTFSLGILTLGLSIVALAMMLIMALSVRIFAQSFGFTLLPVAEKTHPQIHFLSKRKFARWLSLHEQSPNFD